MANLLGTQAPIFSEINILFHGLLIILLIGGIWYGLNKTKPSLDKHHRFFTGIIFLNIISVFLVMIPTVIRSLDFGGPQPSSYPHFIIGSIILLLSITVIFKKFKNLKTIMRLIAILWIIEFISGVGIFFRFFVR